MSKKTLGFIGCGHMGSAILRGVLGKRLFSSARVWVYEIDRKKAVQIKKSFGVRIAGSLEKLAKNSDILVLAIKPQQFLDLGQKLKPLLKKNQLVISILAGTTLGALKKTLGNSVTLVRAMPNLGAQVGESMTALSSVSRSGLETAKKIFNACGVGVVINEKFMNLVTALSGSGPAYFFLLMESMEREAVRSGLQKSDARRLILQTAFGSSLLAKDSLHSPEELRKMVTSKGGTTEAALKVFERSGLGRIVTRAIQAASQRAKELSK